MSRKTLLPLLVLVLVAVAPVAQAQAPKTKPAGSSGTNILNNQSIADMVAGKLSDDVIITAIQASKTDFDLSADALVALKKVGASECVIKAMLTHKNTPAKKTPSPKACAGVTIQLGALTGSDADLLARTLSSTFGNSFVVTSAAGSKSDQTGSEQSAGDSGSDQSSGSKSTLCVTTRDGEAPSPALLQTYPVSSITTLLDQDNFKGGILNSNYVVRIEDPAFANRLAKAFPHPLPDIDVEHAASGYLILIPSPSALGPGAAQGNLAKHAAALRRDFELLASVAPLISSAPTVCDVFCLNQLTVRLSALDPRDVAMHVSYLFGNGTFARVFPLNKAVAILPPGSKLDETTVPMEQYELSQESQKQGQLVASLQPSSGKSASANAAPITTTTTSTTKTSVSTPSTTAAQGSQASQPSKSPGNAGPTTTTTTKTSTTVQPAAQSASSASGQAAGASGGAVSPAGTGTGGAPTAGDGGTSTTSQTQGGGGKSSTPPPCGTAPPSSQTSPPLQLDYIVRLYHFRHAAAIAAAINKAGGGHDLVEPVGTQDDLLMICPGPAGQSSNIHRAIALIDLPRPQLSLQVWSYQISSEAKHEREAPDDRFSRADAAQQYYSDLRKTVVDANLTMMRALQNGVGAILTKAWQDPYFFDLQFRHYLTTRYQDCVRYDEYCLGYYDALQFPTDPNVPPVKFRAEAVSLSKLLLLLVATANNQRQTVDDLIANMAGSGIDFIDFSRFKEQLDVLWQPRNHQVMRAALLDFFFQYKQAILYGNDFVPYDLQRTAHVVDDLFAPIVDAFNQDIDSYVDEKLHTFAIDERNKPGLQKATGLVSSAMVQVATLSGSEAKVNGGVNNYFDITPPMSLSDILNPNQTLATALKDVLEPKEITILTALANIGSQPRIQAQLSRNAALTITPTSLDTASSAELDVDFDVGEPTGAPPATVNQSSSKVDVLNRVADHHVKTLVRVESLKLFQISGFTMELTHPQRGAPVPVIGQVWEGLFGTMPGVKNLFHFPPKSTTVDNRSIAIVRAVVVPTAMDLGLSLHFEMDRVLDPITGVTYPLSSTQQIGGKIRPFHKLLMQCIVDPNNPRCRPLPTLSSVPEDLK